MKNCVVCGEGYLPYHSNQKYCSEECRKEKKKEYNIEHKEEIKEWYKKYCIENKEELKERRKKRYIENKEELKNKNCVVCGESYLPNHDSQKSCSEKCTKERRKKKQKEYNIEHKECRKKKQKEYNIEHKEEIKEWHKKHRIEHKEEIKEWHKKYYIENKEEINERNKKYSIENKEEINKCCRKKYKSDPIFRLRSCISGQFWYALKSRNNSKAGKSWESLAGYTVKELKQHLEKMFKKGMTWKNYGKKWHVDHRIPQSWFKYETTDDPEFKKCWALDNLKPMFASKNISKGNRYSEPSLIQYFALDD